MPVRVWLRKPLVRGTVASVAGVVFVLIVWRVLGRPVAWNAIQLGALPLTLAVTGAVVFLTARAWRFTMLLAYRGRPGAVAGVTGIGWGAGLLLPGPSGDVAFVGAARRVLGVTIARSSGAAVIARLFDLASIALVAALAAGISATDEPSDVIILSAAIAAGAVLLLATLLLRGPRRAVLRVVARLPRVGRLAERAEAAMAELSRPHLAAALAGSTALCRIATAVQYAGLMSMVGLHLGFWQTWFALSIRTLLFTVPIQGIAGIGTSQAWWTSALVLQGLPLGAAVSASVTLQALDLAISLPIAALCSLLALRARASVWRGRRVAPAREAAATPFAQRAVPQPQQIDGR
ncbi:MAG: lysylphosphatidylglycerol synthase domain-containing protein [Candidatus Dormibacteria bacterium]